MNEKENKIFDMMCTVIDEQEAMSVDIFTKLEQILELLANDTEKSKIEELVKQTIVSMQSQDIHRQKIERIANLIHPQNTRFAKAKHITADECDDLASEDDIEALIRQAAKN